VPFPRPYVDIHRPPKEFDALVDWFELVSSNLVLLEEYSITDIRSALETLTGAIDAHRREASLDPPDPPFEASEHADLAQLLSVDHEWFRISVEQLYWCFAVVEREDHGGNRQALGQYGRVLAESLRRHRSDERRFLAERSVNRPADPSPLPSSNAN